MQIKAIIKLPRLITIPGKIKNRDYRSLQAGKTVEIENDSATYLIERGFAKKIEAEKVKAKSGGENK